MLKVLIADDEAKVCQLLLHLIDWNELGLEIVEIVNDGESAYKAIDEKKPDIVITDIRMPHFDGLELIRRSKERFPNMYFIIISGYSHFDYAHSAIKYGVEDYLLKPLKKKELLRALIKIIEKQNALKAMASESEKLQSIIHNTEEKVRKNLIAEMFMNPDGVKKSIERGTINQEYHCHFVDGYFSALKIQPFLSDDEWDEAALALLLSKLHHMVKERIEACCEELVTSVHENYVLCIINTKDFAMQDIKRQLNKMKMDFSNLKDIFHRVRVIIGFGGIKDHMSDLFRSLEETDISILNRIGDPGKHVIEYDMIRFAEVAVSDIVDLKFRNGFLGCLERFDTDGVLEKIQSMESRLESYAYDGTLIYNCYLEVANIYLFGVKNYNIEVDVQDIDWFKKRYNMYMTLQDVFAGLKRDIREMLLQYEEKKKMADKKPIRMAKQYIHEKYNEALSLDIISAHIGFNPAYLSYLFKKETGKNFMEYVMEVRIEHAKQFLIHTNKDLHEISVEVGYTDVKYFSKLFKKITGLNPSEYRKLYS